MKHFKFFWMACGLFLAGQCAQSNAAADTSNPALTGGGVMTRFFREIETLESKLERAVASKDQAMLGKLLSPVFVQQQAGRDLITAVNLLRETPIGTVRLLHVHEAGGVLVAVLTGANTGNALITDVWQTLDGKTWQLRLRVLPVTPP